MRFIIGLATGVALGLAASTLTSGKSGQDLRMEFERIRADLEKRDFEALGAHLEERFKELQTGLEQRYSEFKDASAGAAGAIGDAAEDAADSASGVVKETVDDLAAVPITS